MRDYSDYGPAYNGFTVKDDVYVPAPTENFSGVDPFEKMAKIRGHVADITFDGNYNYLDKSLKFKILHYLCYLVVWSMGFLINRLKYGIKIEGRKNIKAHRAVLKDGAMTICNHVARWDMLFVLHAIRYKTTWIPMYRLPFMGKDGWKMKYIGGVPIPEDRQGLRCFNAAFDELHEKKQWIHIFPESCSWKHYSPIRPFKIGAFNMAYKYNLPIIPCVITFRPRTGFYKLFKTDEPLVTIHVGAPILPDRNVVRKEEANRLRDAVHGAMVQMAGIINNPWPSSID